MIILNTHFYSVNFMYYPCWIQSLHVLSLLDSESSCTIPAGFRVFMYYPCWIQNLHVLSLLDSESSCTIPAGFSVFMYYPCWIQSLYVLVKKNLHCSVLFVLSLEMGIVFVNELIFFVNNGVIQKKRKMNERLRLFIEIKKLSFFRNNQK